MLKNFTVRGFKTLKSVSISLERVTVLVGPNNSGKSNVLRSLRFLSEIVARGFAEALNNFGGASAVFSRGGSDQLDFRLEASLSDWNFVYRLLTPGPALPFGKETLDVTGSHGISTGVTGDGTFGFGDGKSHKWKQPGDLIATAYAERLVLPESIRAFTEFLAGFTIADFSVEHLRASSRATPQVELKSTGENLAAVLDWLDGDRPMVRSTIEDEVKAVVPGVTRLVTKAVDDAGNKVVAIAEGNHVFQAADMSDGILLFIALSTAAQLSGGKSLVCLEEPDSGIHPRRIREVLDQVYRVAERGSQFLITTHSPVLLSAFRDFPEAVLIVDRENDSTRIRSLAQIPDVQSQLADVSLGDLWYSGVLGGVPPK